VNLKPVLVPFTQPDPPRAEAIQRAISILVDGFQKHFNAINCTNDRIDQIIEGGALLTMSLNDGARFGPRPNINLIEGTNVTIQLNEDGPNDEFDVTIAVPGLTGTVTNGANVGTGGIGVGQVFRDKTGTILNFRSIAPLSPLLGLTLGDQVILAIVTTPGSPSEVVGSNRVINGTSPIRINGGASSNLQSDITVSYQFNPRVKTEYWEDFVGLCTILGGVTAQNGWQLISAGANVATAAIPGEIEHPGIIRLTLTTGDVTIGDHNLVIASDGAGQEGILVEGGYRTEWSIRISYPTELGINGNNFITRIGFGDEFANNDFTNGIYVEYDPFTSLNWLRCTAANGARTKTDTGVLATGLFTPMAFVVNSAANSVEFFIDGNSVGSNATNIPTATGREVAPQMQMVADTVNEPASQLISADLDYFWYENNLISR